MHDRHDFKIDRVIKVGSERTLLFFLFINNSLKHRLVSPSPTSFYLMNGYKFLTLVKNLLADAHLDKCVELNLKNDFTKCWCSCYVQENVGAVSLLQEFLLKRISTLHCIIHQQKLMKFSHAMSVIPSIIKALHFRQLKHRVLKTFLEDIGAEYSEFVYCTGLRWLSRGRILQCFVTLKVEISNFQKMN